MDHNRESFIKEDIVKQQGSNKKLLLFLFLVLTCNTKKKHPPVNAKIADESYCNQRPLMQLRPAYHAMADARQAGILVKVSLILLQSVLLY